MIIFFGIMSSFYQRKTLTKIVHFLYSNTERGLFSNIFSPTWKIVSGRITFSRRGQSAKASSPTESRLAGATNSVRPEPLNAPSRILIMPSGRVTVFTCSMPRKDVLPIFSTGSMIASVFSSSGKGTASIYAGTCGFSSVPRYLFTEAEVSNT